MTFNDNRPVDEALSGRAPVDERTLGAEAKSYSDNYRLRVSFRSHGEYHRAWTLLIKQVDTGIYRLRAPILSPNMSKSVIQCTTGERSAFSVGFLCLKSAFLSRIAVFRVLSAPICPQSPCPPGVDFTIVGMKLLNLYECANRLNLPPKWLKEAARNGVVPCLRLGKRNVRFHPDAVRRAVAALAAGAGNGGLP